MSPDSLNIIQTVWLSLIQLIFLLNTNGCRTRSYTLLRSTVTIFSQHLKHLRSLLITLCKSHSTVLT